MADAATTAAAATQFIGSDGVIALGASLAMIGGAIGAGWAQASVGSSIMGVVAERPEEAMKLIVYMALPEIIALLGFIIGVLLWTKIGGAEAAKA